MKPASRKQTRSSRNSSSERKAKSLYTDANLRLLKSLNVSYKPEAFKN